MAETRITLTLIGTKEEGGNIRLDDFLRQLEATKKALIETNRLLSQQRSVYYRVVDLHHSSPAAVVLEAVPRVQQPGIAEAVVDTFYTAVSTIQQEGRAPDLFDYDALQAFKQMTELLGRSSIAEISLSRNGDTMSLTDSLAQRIDEILGPDEYERGSVEGMLEHINLHSGQNVFTVYPTSRLPKIRCVFPKELRQQAIAAIDKYVHVFGFLKYKRREWYPYEMRAQSIEVYESEENLPTLHDLRGIAPEAAGDQLSEDFVRGLRDEWE